jgi:3-methyladenine DNA glycosylase AlkD
MRSQSFSTLCGVARIFRTIILTDDSRVRLMQSATARGRVPDARFRSGEIPDKKLRRARRAAGDRVRSAGVQVGVPPCTRFIRARRRAVRGLVQSAPMTVKEVLAQLESRGDDARRKHNTKAGAPDNQFGVKLGDIRTLAKQIKADHSLAMKLWETGNVDAQLLATLAMKPASLSADELDRITRSTSCTQVADWLNAYVVAAHAEKDSLRAAWMKDKDRWAARAGWNLTASGVNKGGDGIDPSALLGRIEKEMPKAKPEVQWTMNNTLAAIGIAYPEHRARAVAIGEKIGLYRDWPVSKGCTPPYVPVWIEAMVGRKGKGGPAKEE